MKTLVGHVSAETAYVQPDYPYSFTLRCQRRVWVETKPKHGQRVVTQTCNPKTGHWNAPKAGTYSALVGIALDDDVASETFGHVLIGAFTGYHGHEELEAFVAKYGDGADPAIVEAYRSAYDRRAARETEKLKAAAIAAFAEVP